MVSFRFPFSFSQPPRPAPRSPPISNVSSRTFSISAVALSAVTAAAVGAGIAVSQSSDKAIFRDALNFIVSNTNGFAPLWGSLSLSEGLSPISESRTGMLFPAVIGESQRLLGVGLRRKAILGLKNIDVYAFGVYADDENVKELLSEKYGVLSASELKGKGQLRDDLMDGDMCMTVRLQIAYGRLSIRSVRSAFEESVGSRLQKFGGSDNKELLQRFTSQFKDEYKIPRGSIIDLSRERGYVLRTIIDGNDVGSIQSKLLCRAILDLYIGNMPFDQKAKEDVELNLANLVGK